MKDWLQEVWEKGKLKSDIPSPIRHRIPGIYRSFRDKGMDHKDALSAAFAVATSAARKSGELSKKGRVSTKKGAGRSGARAKRKSATMRDMEYERTLSGHVEETKSRGIFNQSGPKRESLGRRRGWDGTITPKPTKNWLTHGAIKKASKPKRLRRKRYRKGTFERLGTAFEWIELAEGIVRGE